jgi:hypothetical protein
MKTIRLFAFLLTANLVLLQAAVASNSLGVGGKLHCKHSEFTDLPFDQDLSYDISYEYREDAAAFWQLAVGYTPKISGTNNIDSVITPEVNLLFSEGVWRGGVGVLNSFVMEGGEGDWMDIYFQFLLGIGVPVGKFSIDATACYVFPDWGSIGNFDMRDIDFGLRLTYHF